MRQYTAFPPMRFFTEVPAVLPLLLCLVVLLSGGCAGRSGGGADFAADDGPIRFVLPGGAPAGERDIMKLAGEADYILLGEQHDNPTDHRAQATIVGILAARNGLRPLIGLEMLPRRYYDFQLAAFSKGETSLADLPEALNWKNTWGYDFALYQPVFAIARQYGLKLYGLNLPDAVRRSVGRKGLAGLSETEKSELPARIIPPQPEQREKLLAVFRMHAAMSGKNPVTPAADASGEKGRPEALPAMARTEQGKARRPGRTARAENKPEAQGMLDRFMLIQSLWDSTMAEQAVEIRKSARLGRIKQPAEALPPMVILAGAGHVEYGYGIASRIKVFDPGARIVLVMPFSGESPDRGAADLYYYSEQRSRSPYGFTFTERGGGLLIVNVVPGSRAEKAGMRPGDGISRAGDIFVHSPEDLHKAAVQAKRQGLPLRFTLDRGGETVRAVLPDART